MDFPMKEAAEMLIEPPGIGAWDAKNTVETEVWQKRLRYRTEPV